jgi:hypothetical protein
VVTSRGGKQRRPIAMCWLHPNVQTIRRVSGVEDQELAVAGPGVNGDDFEQKLGRPNVYSGLTLTMVEKNGEQTSYGEVDTLIRSIHELQAHDVRGLSISSLANSCVNHPRRQDHARSPVCCRSKAEIVCRIDHEIERAMHRESRLADIQQQHRQIECGCLGVNFTAKFHAHGPSALTIRKNRNGVMVRLG